MRSDRLKELRIKNGYTQGDLADLVNVGLRQIQRYEKGETEPPASMVAQIALALGTSADYLVGLIDDPTPYAQVHSDLTAREKQAISAWRRGDIGEAIKVMVSE